MTIKGENDMGALCSYVSAEIDRVLTPSWLTCKVLRQWVLFHETMVQSIDYFGGGSKNEEGWREKGMGMIIKGGRRDMKGRIQKLMQCWCELIKCWWGSTGRFSLTCLVLQLSNVVCFLITLCSALMSVWKQKMCHKCIVHKKRATLVTLIHILIHIYLTTF